MGFDQGVAHITLHFKTMNIANLTSKQVRASHRSDDDPIYPNTDGESN